MSFGNYIWGKVVNELNYWKS